MYFMPSNPIQFLLRAVEGKSPYKLSDLRVLILHDSPKGNVKEISGCLITRVENDCFYYTNNNEQVKVRADNIVIVGVQKNKEPR